MPGFGISKVSGDRATTAAFLIISLLFGGTYVAIPITVHALGLFWGAAMRLGVAPFLLLIIKSVRRTRFPGRGVLAYVVIYGVVTFGGSVSLLYWGETAVAPDVGLNPQDVVFFGLGGKLTSCAELCD